MARTTVAAVQAILSTDLTEAQISAFITDASLWVDTHLEGACTSLTATLLAAIEKYLAAHLATARDARLRQAKLADVSETYQRDDKVSEYLRAAIALDPCGVVSAKFLDQEDRRPVRFRVGEGFDDQLDLPTD
jgi:hypothetical protein